MDRGRRLRERYKARVRASAHELTVRFPPVVVPFSGAAPAALPASPLTGALVATPIVPVTTVPGRSDVTLDCLWYDEVSTARAGDSRITNTLAMVQGATALASVLVEDAAEDPLVPGAATVFDSCEAVLHQGARFRVLAVRPIGAGFYDPHHYFVWLGGALWQ